MGCINPRVSIPINNYELTIIKGVAMCQASIDSRSPCKKIDHASTLLSPVVQYLPRAIIEDSSLSVLDAEGLSMNGED